jgi:hypothetical protein
MARDTDTGHGGIFQYHEEFVKEALEFPLATTALTPLTDLSPPSGSTP